MMKKIIICIITAIVALLFLFAIVKEVCENDCFTEKINQKHIDIDHFNRIILRNIFKNEFTPVNNCTLSLNNESAELIDILLKDENNKLVFRISEFNCSICVNHIVDKLKEHFTNYSLNQNIIIIYDNEKLRYSNGICDKQAYLTNNRNILGLPAENTNLPFLFILNKDDMMAKMVFIPDKGMPELTDEYLKIIKKRFLNN